jgi:hypothetical protein
MKTLRHTRVKQLAQTWYDPRECDSRAQAVTTRYTVSAYWIDSKYLDPSLASWKVPRASLWPLQVPVSPDLQHVEGKSQL